MILNIREGSNRKVYITEGQCGLLVENSRDRKINQLIGCAYRTNLISEGIESDRYDKCGFELLVGIPGCGKSTYLRKVSHDNVIVVCPDDIRRELTGNISDQSRNGDVWKLAEERIIEGLSAGRYVILDATNVNTRSRVGLVGRVKSSCPGIKVYATVFDCNPDISKERIGSDISNGVDRSNVPDFVIDRMYSQYLETLDVLKDEGFDGIFRYGG